MDFRVVFKVEPRTVLGTSNYSEINVHNPFSTLYFPASGLIGNNVYLLRNIILYVKEIETTLFILMQSLIYSQCLFGKEQISLKEINNDRKDLQFLD